MKERPVDDNEEILSNKFVGSSLAEAIRNTLTNAVPGVMASKYSSGA
jgi:hypothetical protein